MAKLCHLKYYLPNTEIEISVNLSPGWGICYAVFVTKNVLFPMTSFSNRDVADFGSILVLLLLLLKSYYYTLVNFQKLCYYVPNFAMF